MITLSPHWPLLESKRFTLKIYCKVRKYFDHNQSNIKFSDVYVLRHGVIPPLAAVGDTGLTTSRQ